MRVPNPELERKIRAECLNLLLEKEPETIGIREIAQACAVSSPTIYYYYKDKESLFDAVKLDCIAEMDRYIQKKLHDLKDSAEGLRASLEAFRDWAFENPRIALLVMGRFKPNLEFGPDELGRYYASTYFGKALLDRLVESGVARSTDTLMDSSLCIAGVWGAIESILLYRTVPEYWKQGRLFTDKMIALCCSALIADKE